MDLFSGKTVLITGATGLIGSNLVDRFMQIENVNVIALSHSKDKLNMVYSKYKNASNFQIVVQDVCDPLLKDMPPLDYVFHAAGSISRETIKNQPISIIRPNIFGTISLLEYLKRQKEEKGIIGKIVVFSSATVYGVPSGNIRSFGEKDTEFSEQLHSITAPYSEAKRMAEVISLAYYRQHQLDVMIVRPSYVYGFTPFAPNTAFYEFVRKVSMGEDIVLENPNAPKRDYIYIDDFVDGLITVATHGKIGETYNISSNGDYGNFASIHEIAHTIITEANLLIKTSKQLCIKYNTPPKECKEGVLLKNAKLKEFGWHITYPLEIGIRKTIEKYKRIKDCEDFLEGCEWR